MSDFAALTEVEVLNDCADDADNPCAGVVSEAVNPTAIVMPINFDFQERTVSPIGEELDFTLYPMLYSVTKSAL
jgi:hypothetical protein